MRVAYNGATKWFATARDISSCRVIFNGSGGDDVFQNNTVMQATAHGGAGNDRLEGGYGIAYLYGDTDNDILIGLSGTGVAYRPAGDYLYGGGDDYLSASERADYLYGGIGNDALVGGGGADFLYGNAGRDRFQMEGHGNRNNPYAFYFNRDDAADYTAGQDSFYGADALAVSAAVSSTAPAAGPYQLPATLYQV